MLVPPRIGPKFPGGVPAALAAGDCDGSPSLLCALFSHSAILSLFWYPATARSANKAVIDGYPRLILCSFSLMLQFKVSAADRAVFPVVTSSSAGSLGSATGDHSPYSQYDDCADDCSYQASAFPCLVPSDGLSEERGNKGPPYSEQGRQNKTGGFIRPGMKEFCDQPCYEAYENCPNNTHRILQSTPATNEIGHFWFRCALSSGLRLVRLAALDDLRRKRCFKRRIPVSVSSLAPHLQR